MKTKITLSNGDVFIVEQHPEDFAKNLYNQVGVLLNKILNINGNYIQSSHIVRFESHN